MPMPNTEVKLPSADDTWRATAWESRTPPVFFRPYGQAVKTPPFHGGNPGSIPGRVTKGNIRFSIGIWCFYLFLEKAGIVEISRR